jgi:hypothetical protein
MKEYYNGAIVCPKILFGIAVAPNVGRIGDGEASPGALAAIANTMLAVVAVKIIKFYFLSVVNQVKQPSLLKLSK